jgi:transketolase
MTRHVPPINDLENIALSLRRSVVSMVDSVRVGYLLQGLGAADIFTALFFSELNLRTDDPNWSDRDRFILSTAHNTALLYATFAHRGYFPISRLETYTRDGSELEVNASERMGTIIEATCGSLGQGLSVAVGMGLSLRRRGSEARIYVVLGDGELQEGQVWEAALSAGSFGLDPCRPRVVRRSGAGAGFGRCSSVYPYPTSPAFLERRDRRNDRDDRRIAPAWTLAVITER